jgi:hypothetical protein
MKPKTFDFILGMTRRIGSGLREKYEDEARIRWVEGWEGEFWTTYTQLREVLREDMCATDDARIDRHKIAAAITCSILKISPLSIASKAGDRFSWRARCSNEVLAIMSRIAVLRRFTGYGLYQEDRDRADRYRKSPFSWPVTRNTQEVYARQFVKELLQVAPDDEYRKQDMYFLANIYFLLEAYHLLKMGFPPMSFPLDTLVDAGVWPA